MLDIEDKTNVVDMIKWASEKIKFHTKKGLDFTAKSEQAFKENKIQFGKKFLEIAQKEIALAIQWQRKVQLMNTANCPQHIFTARSPVDKESYDKWLTYQYQQIRQSDNQKL